MRKACQGRPVDEDAIALLAQRVEEAIRARGAAEVPSHEVGLAILGPLRELDEVAYLRFASVYRSFESLDDFEREIAALRAARTAGRRQRRRRARPRDEAGSALPDRSAVSGRQASERAVDRDAVTQTEGAAAWRGERHGERGAQRRREAARRRAARSSGCGRPRASTRTTRSTWERRDVVMTNWRDGSINFEQRGVEFPDFWSVNAANIVTTKYFRGAVGTAAARVVACKQLIDRVVDDLPRGRRGARLLRHARPTPRSSTTS